EVEVGELDRVLLGLLADRDALERVVDGAFPVLAKNSDSRHREIDPRRVEARLALERTGRFRDDLDGSARIALGDDRRFEDEEAHAVGRLKGAAILGEHPATGGLRGGEIAQARSNAGDTLEEIQAERERVFVLLG